MPWQAKDARRFTKQADSPKKGRAWSHVADSALSGGASEGSAIRQANAVVRRMADGGMAAPPNDPRTGLAALLQQQATGLPEIEEPPESNVMPMQYGGVVEDDPYSLYETGDLGYGGGLGDLSAPPIYGADQMGQAQRAYLEHMRKIQARKTAPWRQILGSVLSVSPRLKGAAAAVSGEAGRQRDIQQAGVYKASADEERLTEQGKANAQLRAQQLDESRRRSKATEESRKEEQATRQAQLATNPAFEELLPGANVSGYRATVPIGPKTYGVRKPADVAREQAEAKKEGERATWAKLPDETADKLGYERGTLFPPAQHAELLKVAKDPSKWQVKESTDKEGNVHQWFVNLETRESTPPTQIGKGLGKPQQQNAAQISVNTASEDMIDMAAKQYLISGQMPQLGMGGGPLRTKILDRAAGLAKSQGLDPAGIESNKASTRADVGSLGKLQQTYDALVAFENTAKKNLDNFLSVAKQTIDTGMPWANRVFRGGARELGDKNAAQFEALRTVAFTEIAKVLNNPTSNAVLSDSARDEAAKLLSGNYTVPQLMGVAEKLKLDMETRKASYKAQLDEIRGRIKGRGGAVPGGAQPSQATQPAQQPGGGVEKWVRDKSGNLVRQ